MLEKPDGKPIQTGLGINEKKEMPSLPLPFASSQLRSRHHIAEMSFVSCVLSKFLTQRVRGEDNKMTTALAKIQGSLLVSCYSTGLHLCKMIPLLFCLLANSLILKCPTVHFKEFAVIFYSKFLEVLKFSFTVGELSDYLVFHIVRSRN